MVDHEVHTVVRYHTAGRRQPMLIGKDAAGRRLRSGPYTVYQVLAVALVATILWQTRTVWAAEMTGVSSLLVIGAAAIGAGFMTGRFDFSGRNPLWILLALLAATPTLVSVHPGRVSGRSLPTSKPWKVRVIATAALAEVDDRPNPAITESTPPPAQSEPVATVAPVPCLPAQVSVQPDAPAGRLTSLEAFLAAAGKVDY